jgi:serine/threonine-protein kinase
LSPKTPAAIGNLLQRCLDRDVRKRLRDIGEARVILEAPLTGAPETSTSGAEVQRGVRSALHSKIWIAAAAVLFAAAAGLALIHFREKPPVVEVPRFQIPAPENTTLGSRVGTGFHLSPNGRQIAFIAFDRDGGASIWVRSMEAVDARRMAGTEGATAMLWSPDSRFLAFGIGGKVKKIDASGGPIQTLCDSPVELSGGAWNRDGVIIFSTTNTGLWKVSESGGVASKLTELDGSRDEPFLRIFLQTSPQQFLHLRRHVVPLRLFLYD